MPSIYCIPCQISPTQNERDRIPRNPRHKARSYGGCGASGGQAAGWAAATARRASGCGSAAWRLWRVERVAAGLLRFVQWARDTEPPDRQCRTAARSCGVSGRRQLCVRSSVVGSAVTARRVQRAAAASICFLGSLHKASS
jgi:hypothetical protein